MVTCWWLNQCIPRGAVAIKFLLQQITECKVGQGKYKSFSKEAA